ncbi:MAG TPA: TRAP transporter large permease subunit [Acetobacteraceae bacterium]|nr:TRAP transporter large permease subunit [Acetobacteraceae bacterium]
MRTLAERVAAWIVAALCAVILAGGVAVVFLDVIYRYFLSNPLQWSDEVAIAVLIAITFLGAALALYRSEHLGMRTLRDALTGAWAERADGFSAWVVLIVSVCLTWSSVSLLESVAGQTTVSGLLPASIDYIPLPVGGAVMSFFALFQLFRVPARGLLEAAIAVGALAAGFLAWGRIAPAPAGTGIWLMLAVDAACLAAAVPVAFALAAGSLGYMAVTASLPIIQFTEVMQSGVSSFVLLAIPFFVLAGLVMGINGMSKRLIAFLDMVIGRVRGGLSVVMIAAMAVFSGISGSKSADVAAVGSIMLPAMRQSGYDENDAVALLAASAVMGETIPPCINMIILGYVANVSIGGLFIAGLLPAGVMALGLILVAMLTARGRGTHDRDAVPSVPHSLGYLLRTVGGALTGIFLVVIIVGGIVGGVATPTEVSAVAVVYALVVGGLAFREMNWRSFADFLTRSASLSGMILFIVGSAGVLSYLLTVNLIPQHMAALLTRIGSSWGTWAFLLISIGMLIVMGSVLEGAPALIVFAPLLLPAAQKLGVDPLHFGILLVISMGIGLFAPPVGVGLYTACAVGQVPVERVARPIAKYLAIIFIALLLIAFVPAITLVLPRRLGIS